MEEFQLTRLEYSLISLTNPVIVSFIVALYFSKKIDAYISFYRIMVFSSKYGNMKFSKMTLISKFPTYPSYKYISTNFAGSYVYNYWINLNKIILSTDQNSNILFFIILFHPCLSSLLHYMMVFCSSTNWILYYNGTVEFQISIFSKIIVKPVVNLIRGVEKIDCSIRWIINI